MGSVGASAAAGCTAPGEPATDDPATNDTPPSQPRISITDFTDLPQDLDVEIVPTVTWSRVTGENPATVSIATTNRGDARYFPSMRTGIHFHPEYGGETSDQPRGLVLRDTEGGLNISGEPWSVEPITSDQGGSGGYGSTGIVIDEDETVTNEYFVLDDETIPDYYRPQQYTFSVPVAVNPDTGADSSDETVQVPWEFTLLVEHDVD